MRKLKLWFVFLLVGKFSIAGGMFFPSPDVAIEKTDEVKSALNSGNMMEAGIAFARLARELRLLDRALTRYQSQNIGRPHVQNFPILAQMVANAEKEIDTNNLRNFEQSIDAIRSELMTLRNNRARQLARFRLQRGSRFTFYGHQGPSLEAPRPRPSSVAELLLENRHLLERVLNDSEVNQILLRHLFEDGREGKKNRRGMPSSDSVHTKRPGSKRNQAIPMQAAG